MDLSIFPLAWSNKDDYFPGIISRDEDFLIGAEMGAFEVVQAHDFLGVCLKILRNFS